MKRILIFLAILFSATVVYSQQFNGTISSSGYSPPSSSVWVTWCSGGTRPECKSFLLNSSIQWDGQSRDGKLKRYAGGDQSVDGWNLVPAMGSESRGGEIGAALLTLYRLNSISREYTTQELWDFGLSNSCGNYLCGCSWYERVTGQKHPITPGCTNEGSESEGGGLKPCPSTPTGCGKKNNPCLTGDLSIPLNIPTQIACSTGAGRVGRFVLRTTDQNPPSPIDPIDNTKTDKKCYRLEVSDLVPKIVSEIPCS